MLHLTTLQVPRWLGFERNIQCLHLHGFCDASSKAYAAVVYSKIVTNSGDSHVRLLLSKTKVAPIKTISIPRLELCAAQLLARCISFTIDAMKLQNIPVFCWSDSTIVLAWLQKAPSDLKVFVANRVSSIQTKLSTATWLHVPTEDNPADCASRGINPAQLTPSSSWWNGPAWLKFNEDNWPVQSTISCTEDDSELKASNAVHSHHSNRAELFESFNHISTWPRLLRVTAYVLRFKFRTKVPDVAQGLSILQVDEIKTAHRFWIKQMQTEYFSKEIVAFKAKSRWELARIIECKPDKDGLVRVAQVKTASSTFVRPIVKLCKLPVSPDGSA
ncbi:uncharacterized protein LOC114938571 [Nylanderia fulva]|uniref:uncharacterized protein LOC114938571 n=1 Tax=Nylanderia fulva TaxID=613905 RepID=UPI0010FBACAD|nr:uncharacterized protein LOC114938571 [Nylanderia fulva]